MKEYIIVTNVDCTHKTLKLTHISTCTGLFDVLKDQQTESIIRLLLVFLQT